MKKIYDRPIVMEYVKKYGISRFFDTRDLPFFLIRYEKGETIIHPTEHTRYLQFVVEGTVAIYSIRRDGSQFPIASSDDFMMLGDVEFVNQSLPALFAEAKSDTAAVALSLDENKPVLDRDLAFLHYTLRSLVKK
ncbi:cyclic nucleotide-binding domain-containing protein [Eisenbergiella porci]